MIGDKTSNEVNLEQSGDINTLQRYRLGQYWSVNKRFNTKSPFISHKLLFIEEDLREIVQEELSIKEGATLNKDAKDRLDALNAKYWFLEQQWWCYHSCLLDGYRLSYGGPILNGICTACLLKIVLAGVDAVLVDVGVVLTVRLTLHVVLELEIVPLSADAVVELEVLKSLKKIRDF